MVALFAGSCASVSLNMEEPTSITTAKASSIRKNLTTRDDLKTLFGEPEMKIPFPEGVTYFYKDINLHSIWVRFNEDWTVTDFEISQ
jgi:hypothetical protein